MRKEKAKENKENLPRSGPDSYPTSTYLPKDTQILSHFIVFVKARWCRGYFFFCMRTLAILDPPPHYLPGCSLPPMPRKRKQNTKKLWKKGNYLWKADRMLVHHWLSWEYVWSRQIYAAACFVRDMIDDIQWRFTKLMLLKKARQRDNEMSSHPSLLDKCHRATVRLASTSSDSFADCLRFTLSQTTRNSKVMSKSKAARARRKGPLSEDEPIAKQDSP